MGGRSRVAAQMLSGKGFKEVYNLRGGIRAWNDQKVVGPVEEGMALFEGNEPPEELLMLAYGMEIGLESFYRDMASGIEEQEVVNLFIQLAKFEEGHQMRIFKLYQTLVPSVLDRLTFEENIVSEAMEGGLTPEEFLEQNTPAMQTAQDVLDIAMMIEAQAFDLYSRYAGKGQQAEAKTILFKLAEDEKTHLKNLLNFPAYANPLETEYSPRELKHNSVSNKLFVDLLCCVVTSRCSSSKGCPGTSSVGRIGNCNTRPFCSY